MGGEEGGGCGGAEEGGGFLRREGFVEREKRRIK